MPGLPPAPLRVRALVAVLRLLRRLRGDGDRRVRTVDGRELRFRLLPGVHDPEPLPGASFAPLMRAAGFTAGEQVLDVGTGSGVWALLAAAAGARVTATERAGVPLDGLAEAASSLGTEVDRRAGDLFAPVRGRRYDTVCFNPPFHDGAPAPGEEAWVGGGVVRHFLAGLTDHLRPEGRGLLVLPRAEQARYAAELAPWRVERRAGVWLPLLGRVELLELRPRGEGWRPASPPARAWARLAELGDTRSCEVVRLEGRLDPEALARALGEVAGRHPLLSARWERGGWRLGGAPPPLEVVDAPWAIDRAALVDRAWADGDPARVDVALLRGPDTDWLRVRAPHDRTDARSGAQVVQDLADAYGALVEGRPLPTEVDGAPWDPDHLLPRRPLDLLRALGRLAADLVAPATWRVAPEAPRGATRVRVVDLPPATLPALKARAAARGTTVHALLTLWAARTAGVTRLVDLVTVRPLASADVGGRADVLVVPWVQTVPVGSDTRALAAVEAQVAGIKGGGARAELARVALYGALADLVPTARAAALTFRRVIKTDLIVTNPGPVHAPLERFGPVPVADFVNFPQLVPPARSGYVFTTFRGRLRVVALWDDATWPAGPPPELDALLARIEAEVGAA